MLDDARPCLNEFKRFIEHYLTLSLFSFPNTQYFSIIHLKIIIISLNHWIMQFERFDWPSHHGT